MFNKLLIYFLDLKNICFDTNIIEIGIFLAILETKMYFTAAILNFQLFGGEKLKDFVVPGSLNSALSRAQCYKFSCFYPDVHTQGTFCYISAPLYTFVVIFVCKSRTLLKEILLKHAYKYNDVIRPLGYERMYTLFHI